MDEENPENNVVSLAEVKEMLIKDEKDRELTYDKRVALDHATTFNVLTPAKTRDLVKKLVRMEKVNRLNAQKVAELMPRDADELRPVFAKERFTLEADEIEAILEAVRKYV